MGQTRVSPEGKQVSHSAHWRPEAHKPPSLQTLLGNMLAPFLLQFLLSSLSEVLVLSEEGVQLLGGVFTEYCPK